MTTAHLSGHLSTSKKPWSQTRSSSILMLQELGWVHILRSFCALGPNIHPAKETQKRIFRAVWSYSGSIVLWAHRLQNDKSLYSVTNLVSSSCGNFMVLICVITLTSLRNNVRFFTWHVQGQNNKISYLLSRNKIAQFRALERDKGMDPHPEKNPRKL